jgi:hypothetical protein
MLLWKGLYGLVEGRADVIGKGVAVLDLHWLGFASDVMLDLHRAWSSHGRDSDKVLVATRLAGDLQHHFLFRS